MTIQSNLASFIQSQQDFLTTVDFDDYLPVVFVVSAETVDVHILADAPEGPDLEPAVRAWAESIARMHDYYAAFKFDDERLKVIYRESGRESDTLVDARD